MEAEDHFWELVFSSSHAGPGNWTQDVKLGSGRLYPLSHAPHKLSLQVDPVMCDLPELTSSETLVDPLEFSLRSCWPSMVVGACNLRT